MKQATYQTLLLIWMAFLMFWLCQGCGTSQTAGNTGASSKATQYTPGTTNVLVPEAGGSDTVEAAPLTLDFSNADQGYFIATLSEDVKVNIQLSGPDGVNYKYFLETAGEETVFPFTAGSGAYVVLAFEHIGNDQYISLLSYSLEVNLQNEFLPFLYPNQYVNFSSESEAVALAGELSADCSTDLEALNAIYTYITEHITYDYEKADTVETGYLPDIDDTLRTGTGICFDYAALTTAMLRALSIPAKLSIGYNGEIRHAWVDVYIESIGWVERAIEFSGNEWKLMDPTLASVLGNEEAVSKYTGDGESYTLQYVR